MKMLITYAQAVAAGDFSKPVRLLDGRCYWIMEDPEFHMWPALEYQTAYVRVEPAAE